MLTLPTTDLRDAQPYIFIPFKVTMQQMQTPADKGFPPLFAYIARHGLTPVSPPFYNYRRIDMDDTLDVEAGIAIAAPGPVDAEVSCGTLPGGRFLGLTWHGHPDQLITATGMLIGWANLTQQPFDMDSRADGDHFACRLEIYHTDPDDEPDMDKWETTLAFKLRD